MVSLDLVHSDNASLVQRPLVAVFFGGTSGIGSYTIRALARQSAESNGKGFRAYIVGRNEKAAAEITAECKTIFPRADITFVRASNLALIRETDKACAEIIKLEKSHGNDARIDYVMLSHAGIPYLPREDTEEGLDKSMSLMYYSRMRAVTQLQPLLLKAPKPATVVSVFAAGMEDKFEEELSLRGPGKFDYNQARSNMVYMHVAFFEKLAQQTAGKISFIHIYPGLVLGPGFHNPELPRWFRFVWHWIFVPFFARFMTVPTNESGERMFSLKSSRYPPLGDAQEKGDIAGTQSDGGSYSLHWNGESNYNEKAYSAIDKAQLQEKVWNHTNKAFEVIAAGGVFTE